MSISKLSGLAAVLALGAAAHAGPSEPERLTNAVRFASAMLCGDQEIRSTALEEIRQEKAYAAKGGGVVDMKELHDNQDSMRWADHHAADMRRWLSKHHAKPLSCSDKGVKELRACMAYIQEPPGISWFKNPQAEGCAGLPAEIIAAGLP